MKKTATSRGRAAIIAAISAAALALTVAPLTYATAATTTTTTTSTSPTPAASSTGLISAGPSRSECLTPNIATGKYGLSYLQSLVTAFDSVTDSSVTCISSYLESPTWQTWEDPWITQPQYGYSSWVAEDPQNRQLVLDVNLIPLSLEDVNNPSKWEQACDAGKFNGYARTFGQSLVAAGLENSVIRLGGEMNGVWEPDFIGTKVAEQKHWATCFANEVTAMRQATGEHFLIDWNVNACKGNYPYANFYPGNAYVNIIGLDLYDVACETPYTPVTFKQLSNEQAGLTRFEAFAAAKGKPMSFPEWGLSSVPSGDDPAYIDGIGQTVDNGNFAFETYFDASGPNVKALPLGTHTPLSLPAFKEWFGVNSSQ